MSPFRFCLVLGAATVFLAGALAAVNYVVDPYLIFGVARAPGFNAIKPSVVTRERMMKAYQVARAEHRTVVIGSSRVDMGIDPAAPAWPAAAQPVYNLGIVGSDASTGLKYVRHYLALHPEAPLKTLVVGLDFESFLYVPRAGAASEVQSPGSRELEERLAVDARGAANPERTGRVWKDRMLGLLSLDALWDSGRTLAGNRMSSLSNLEPNGHLSEAGMRDAARADGFGLLFAQKHRDTVQQYARPRRVLSDKPDGPIAGFAMLRELFSFARQHQLALVLVIQPVHVTRWEVLDRMGYWNDYERWKRELATLAAQPAGAGTNVVLWDFGGYEAPLQEAVPGVGRKGPDMQWFWDPVHYNSRLGAWMVARVFGQPAPADFGIVLTPHNVEQRLAQVRRDRAAYRAAQPTVMAEMDRLVCGGPCPAAAPTLVATP